MILNLLILVLTLDVLWLFVLPRKDYERKCKEVSSFLPNACNFQYFMKNCQDLCYRNRNNLKCGKKHSRYRRIVGGNESDIGQYPWLVSLRLGKKQWCSGSILSEKYVLTAAHCFDRLYTSINPSEWNVHSGDHLLSTKDKNEKIHKIKQILAHKKYNIKVHTGKKGQYAVAENDIAILELKDPFSFSRITSNLCIPDETEKFVPDNICNIFGWGHLKHNGVQPEKIHHAQVPIISNRVCNEAKVYNSTIDEKQSLCAGYADGKIDACNFDSGGGLACEKNGVWYVTGIVSSGFECGRPNSYGIYSNVSNFKNWIIKTILS